MCKVKGETLAILKRKKISHGEKNRQGKMAAEDIGKWVSGAIDRGTVPRNSTRYQPHLHILAEASLKCLFSINYCTLDLGRQCLKTHSLSGF